MRRHSVGVRGEQHGQYDFNAHAWTTDEIVDQSEPTIEQQPHSDWYLPLDVVRYCCARRGVKVTEMPLDSVHFRELQRRAVLEIDEKQLTYCGHSPRWQSSLVQADAGESDFRWPKHMSPDATDSDCVAKGLPLLNRAVHGWLSLVQRAADAQQRPPRVLIMSWFCYASFVEQKDSIPSSTTCTSYKFFMEQVRFCCAYSAAPTLTHTAQH